MTLHTAHHDRPLRLNMNTDCILAYHRSAPPPQISIVYAKLPDKKFPHPDQSLFLCLCYLLT